MAGRAHKTEHAGAKRGRGAYWGRKTEAKRESNRLRRENAKRAVRREAGTGITSLNLSIG
jgi:hypothetical protein